MNIYETIDGILSGLFEHHYHVMPDLSNGEPDIYACYITSETPSFFSADEMRAKEYLVKVFMFTPQIDLELYTAVKSAFKESGFIYKGGSDGAREDYPGKKIYTMEFSINDYEEE